MPLDPSKHHQDRRRLARDPIAAVRQDGMFSREIEMKRNRGEISCAECRRLKIKCDKQIPCQSCQRRGCASLCPNGSLATGQGTRFVIAATEHLHRRIARMGDRIRQLEDALALLQASISKEPHPLLSENAIIVDVDIADKPHESEDEVTGEVSTALGTLSVSDQGLSRFFGSTGGSDLLLLDNEDSTGSPSQRTESDSSKGSNLPPELQRFSYAFPFTPMGPVKDVIPLIRSFLPPWEQASAMAESYLASATWIFRSVTRHQLVNEMLPSIYRKLPYPSEEYNGPHDLALLFSIFALGSALDVSLPTRTAESEGEHYNQLALAALCLQPVLEKPSLITIQTLHIVSIYHAMLGNDVSGGESSMEFTWSLVNLAAHLAQTIGLHRDPAQWETNPKVVQRRRMVFWDLFVADSWHSLSTGRPPTFNRDFIDCKFPQEDDLPATLDPGDNSSPSSWGFRFALDGMAEIIARTLTATPPRYSAIKELDRRIGEFCFPPEALEAIRGGPNVDPLSIPLPTSMLLFLFSTMQDVILLFLHRNYFVQALVEDPDDPMRSQYAPSFLATVRASKTILQVVKEQLSIQRVMVCRFWTIWTYTFSATVVFAFIVTRAPRTALANDAMTEFEKGCSLVAEAAKDNRRAARALLILQRMGEKARRALEAARNIHPLDLPRAADSVALGMGIVKKEEIDDEFAVFAGRTKVFRPGATSLPAPQALPVMMTNSSGSGDGMSPDEAHVGHAQVEPPPHPLSAPHQQHPQHHQHHQHPHQHQHQHHQYHQQQYSTYAPEQPQYTLEATHSIPQYMTTSYAYSQRPLPPPQPPHSSLSSTTSTASPLGLHGSHAPAPPPHHHPQHQHQHHPEDLAELRSYAAAALAPQTELSQLGLAANGSRVNETWMSFMHQHSGLLNGGSPGGQHL
ncbi:fungal-specific transcription factor domain-containing protein [Russula aff. rugulosa BPL654]|nr:fungal-specific transcription factor domain-containing protein [Russula aff. rugulosa BPL654]